MRKIISTLAVAALLFAGATSCNKESGNEAMDTGAGSVKVKLSLNKGTLSRAASSARPTTAWSDMSNMMILFVTAGGTETAQVMDARSIAIPDMSDDATATFTDVKASDANGWDAYIVGNYPAAWTPGNVVGKRLSELTIVAPANPDYATSVLGTVTGTAYGESPEVFVAKQTGVKVIPGAADPTHPSAFKIARAVSMARVRIERNSTETPANATISFVDGLFAIRRATTTYGMFGTYNYLTTDVATGFANFPGTFTPTPSPATNVFFSNKGMVESAPASGYENGNSIMSDGVDFWNDYMVWSGGHPSDNAMRFDIVIAGKTTNDDYISFEGDKLVSGTYVYWTAAVNNQMGPNQILELMLKLNTPGSTTPPEVGSYGDLIIEGELVNWGDIVYEEIPM